MAHEFRHLFTPLRVGGLTLKNRIFSTGHAEAMAEDGKPGPRLRAYHEAKARGGAALTIIGGSTSVHPSSPASAWNMIANHDDSVIAGYRAVAEAVRRHDCRIMSQLTHMGRRSQSDVESWHVLLAPSQIPEKVHREVPHELEPEQIAMLVRAFGDAARRCREGDLEGVELSFAHNHLVDQFWSPLFNRRTDEYGGSLENRLRFGFEVLREIRRQVGRDWVVGARISGDEMTAGWPPRASWTFSRSSAELRTRSPCRPPPCRTWPTRTASSSRSPRRSRRRCPECRSSTPAASSIPSTPTRSLPAGPSTWSG
jgi:2,4-dienoyl-CoA reductase-like NADH-dependent reductase (Old Yellow Enzyme family)